MSCIKSVFQELGVETSDSSSFFSLRGPQWRTNSQLLERKFNEQHSVEKYFLELHDGGGVLSISTKIQNNEMTRQIEFKSTRDTRLLDLVCRFVVPRKLFDHAIIGEETIYHLQENVYHQYETDRTSLIGSSSSLHFKVSESATGDEFKQVLYVRDEPESWVVHVRLLPTKSQDIVIKLNTSWYNKLVPRWVETLLFSIPGLVNKLIYRGERSYPWPLMKKIVYRILPLSAYPLGFLPKDTSLSLTVISTLEEKERGNKGKA